MRESVGMSTFCWTVNPHRLFGALQENDAHAFIG
jgi:hypothetical protein